MAKVTVIAGAGAIVRGPAELHLSKAQHARRRGVLGAKYQKGGKFRLDGGQEVQFKYGETFGLTRPEGKLSRSQFEFGASENGADAEDGTEKDVAAEEAAPA